MSDALGAIVELIGEIINHFLVAIVIAVMIILVNAIYVATALPDGSMFAESQSTAMNMFRLCVELIDLAGIAGIVIAAIVVIMKLRSD